MRDNRDYRGRSQAPSTVYALAPGAARGIGGAAIFALTSERDIPYTLLLIGICKVFR